MTIDATCRIVCFKKMIAKLETNFLNQILNAILLTHDLISMAPCTNMVIKHDVVIVVPNSHIPTVESE